MAGTQQSDRSDRAGPGDCDGQAARLRDRIQAVVYGDVLRRGECHGEPARASSGAEAQPGCPALGEPRRDLRRAPVGLVGPQWRDECYDDGSALCSANLQRAGGAAAPSGGLQPERVELDSEARWAYVLWVDA